MNRTHYFLSLVGLGAGLAASFLACSDDDTPAPTVPSTTTGGQGGSLTGGGGITLGGGSGKGGSSNVGGNDAGGRGGAVSTTGGSGGSGGSNSSGGQGGADTGVTETPSGNSGTIYAEQFVLFGDFFQDDTVIRTPEEPGCVLFVRSLGKPRSDAGDILVNGDYFGKPGGPPSTITVSANTMNGNVYEKFLDGPPLFFPNSPAQHLQIEKKGVAGLPAIPVTSLRTPTSDVLTVKTPAVPANNVLDLKASQPLNITWTVPAASPDDANLPPARIIVGLKGLSNTDRVADLRCGFPAAKGSAKVPASLFQKIRAKLPKAAGGDQTLTGGRIHIWLGDQREIHNTTNGADTTYVLEVTRPDGTSFGEIDASLAE